MGQVLIRKLSDATLDDYRAAARAKGSSVEAELRALIETHRPRPVKDREALGALSRKLRAMTPPDGSDGRADSTSDIRWDRDTDHGRWLDDGWADHVAGR